MSEATLALCAGLLCTMGQKSNFGQVQEIPGMSRTQIGIILDQRLMHFSKNHTRAQPVSLSLSAQG